MIPEPRRRPPLDEAALQAAAGRPWTVRLHPTAESTNAVAAAEPARDLVVVADHQTAGRGRRDRSWLTPPGAALTFSAVVDPVVEPEWWPLVPLVAGYAVARAIGVGAVLKWPNDVLIGERKVCGILSERVSTVAHGREQALAVVGIGINVDQDEQELPVPTATSLALAGYRADRTRLFGDVLHALRAHLGLLASSPHGFMNSYRGLSATLDSHVRVELPDGRTASGLVRDIDAHGRLVLDDGPTVAAGDVVHVRPAG